MIDQSDLHPDLPKHLKNQLLLIKTKIHHIEKLVRRHHFLSRRGQYWHNKAKRLDKRYRQIWYLHPYPEKIETFNMVDIHTTLSVDIQKMPISGFVKRLRLPLTVEAAKDFRQSQGQNMDNLWVKYET